MDPVGVGAVAVVLAAGTAAGIWRNRVSGRLRDVSGAGPASASAVPPAAASAVSMATSAVGKASAAPGNSVSVGDAVGAASSEAADSEVAGSEAANSEVAASEFAGSGAAGSEVAGSEGRRLDPALLAGLGVVPGERATLLQFSSAFCAPCRALRRISTEVADLLPGVRHVEVDAESHLDAVRSLGIWRTPTLLVLDRDGRVTKRATGVPTKPHLIAALAEVA